MTVTSEMVELFERYTDKTPTHWVWQGTLTTSGYPRLQLGSVIKRASHIAVALDGVDIPEGHEVSPHCGERICVNPQHLEVISSVEARRRPRKPRPVRVLA